ncbi:MAG: DUF1015 domain-containing protein [Candidatus Saelkia tenebricola]|nr:DUF1015 domain-containing protein [Candidatus Saelkia tenebricola]
MAQIKAFKGLLYNGSKVEIDKVITPPYDVIGEEMRSYFHNLSPYNIIKLILNDSDSPYKEARKVLNSWIEKEVLVADTDDAIYLYRQVFNYRGKSYNRYGFISLLKLEDPGSEILPHEKTYEGPKKDRFNLLIETEANLSPIFVAFSDKEKRLLDIFKKTEQTEAVFDFDFENVIHSFWKIIDTDIIDQFKEVLSDKYILIADGHHRYEVALNYRNLRRKENSVSKEAPYDYVMSFFAPIEQEGLLILPTHRLVNLEVEISVMLNKLSGYFEVIVCDNKEQLFNGLCHQKYPSFGLYVENKFYLLKIKKSANNDFVDKSDPLSKLDVVVFQNLILNNIFNYQSVVSYTQNEDEAIERVNSGEFNAAFLLRATSMEQVVDVAEKKLLMPQKSTYFYPKVLTGLLIHKF